MVVRKYHNASAISKASPSIKLKQNQNKHQIVNNSNYSFFYRFNFVLTRMVNILKWSCSWSSRSIMIPFDY